MSETPESLTGVWYGFYSYPTELDPQAFTATLVQSGAHLGGSTHETIAWPREGVFTVTALLDGLREGSAVRFSKRYDGANGWNHEVLYEGLLSPETDEIEGTWRIPGDWSGRFVMVRAAKKSVSEALRLYERA